MKDFLPTFTFGFLMAQLFPGAVSVLCVTCAYAAWATGTVPDMLTLFAKVGDFWFISTRNAVVFLFLAAATGMFLHGLDWMILGWETTCRDIDGTPQEDDGPSIRDFKFHLRPLWRQILFAPFHMVKEIVNVLRCPALKWVTMDDNISQIKPSAMPLFSWLQDFYLYFGQFYIHMSYAALTGLFSLGFTYYFVGLNTRRLLFFLACYLLTGVFFVMGREQLATLFKNEHALVDLADQPTEPVEMSEGE